MQSHSTCFFNTAFPASVRTMRRYGFDAIGLLTGFLQALLLLALSLLALSPALARADDELPDRVGRVATVSGELFLSPGDRASEWAPIGINYSVTSGDNLWLSGDGRAEVDYGGGQFRLGADTSVQLSQLDDRQLALFVGQGQVVLRLRTTDAFESAQIDTPGAQIQVVRAGLYRIDVSPDGQATTLTVREGAADFLVAGATQQALAGQTVWVSAADPSVAMIDNGVGVDEFDTWSAERDRRYQRSATAYVSPQMVGAPDLDEYGRWESHPEYGPVWFPSAVAPDWVPYRDGYWTTVGAWGLTWVDSAPWGFAPFHYGRWSRFGNRWGWCPGAYVARPAWAPALVAWYGGPGWGYSRNAGAPVYGWVPLGWREPYRPGWSNCGDRCWARHNRPYAVEAARSQGPPSRYANAAVPGSLTAISGATLIRAKPVAINAIKLPQDAISGAPALATAPNVRVSPQSPAPRFAGQLPGVPPSTRRAPNPPRMVSDPPMRTAPAPMAIPGSPARGIAPPPARVEVTPQQPRNGGMAGSPEQPREGGMPATPGGQRSYGPGRNAPPRAPTPDSGTAAIPPVAMPPMRTTPLLPPQPVPQAPRVAPPVALPMPVIPPSRATPQLPPQAAPQGPRVAPPVALPVPQAGIPGQPVAPHPMPGGVPSHVNPGAAPNHPNAGPQPSGQGGKEPVPPATGPGGPVKP